MNTTIRAFFGDQERTFTLDSAMIRELEALTGVGVGALYARLADRSFHYGDLVAVIRLALIGGNTDPKDAERLINAYVHGRPLEASYALGLDIMTALWFGAPEVVPVPAHSRAIWANAETLAQMEQPPQAAPEPIPEPEQPAPVEHADIKPIGSEVHA